MPREIIFVPSGNITTYLAIAQLHDQVDKVVIFETMVVFDNVGIAHGRVNFDLGKELAFSCQKSSISNKLVRISITPQASIFPLSLHPCVGMFNCTL